ncbi:B3 domain-containing protein [Abeliophyllum distichum]|uniref:B3 domain-containing protein n=1 Tax=Abeliophyllum distichum TaxID=126358 RepID=A0ABD1NY05_9LAMI
MDTDQGKNIVLLGDKPLAAEFHRQSFFKVLLCDANFEQVRIPSGFLLHAQVTEEPFGVRTLTGPSGHKWKVKLSIEGKNIYIKDGWQRFYRENSLKDYDFLVFRQCGNFNFDVQIFDKRGVEKTNR